ncbi:MAG: hypothetical protein GY928_16755, partial [Colwellia sp.]|nr:hypothetical protein [Colwellia sp.]
FQALGVDWLFGVSGVLADDMGLGKTVQLSVAAQRHALYKSSSLVLCPVAALGVWEQHLTEWTDIKPFRFHGSSRAKALTAFHDYKGPKALISTHGLIERHSYQVNYGSLGREGKEGEFNIDWDLLIIDEAHKIGVTPGGKRVRATMAVTRSCAQVWCATGTPVNDSPRDMWVLMSYVNPELFGSYDCFTSRYCIMRENPW